MVRLWRGFNIVEVITCAALSTAVGFAVLPHYAESSERTRIAQFSSETVRTGSALAAYYVDHGTYPPSARPGGSQGWVETPGPAGRNSKHGSGAVTANSFAPRGAGSRAMVTFRVPRTGSGDVFATLTTPLAYLPTLPSDPFAYTEGAAPGYYAAPESEGWIMFSLGPDRDENGWEGPGDISPRVESLFASGTLGPDTWRPSDALMQVTYDPSNGAYSNGDIWRAKIHPQAARRRDLSNREGRN